MVLLMFCGDASTARDTVFLKSGRILRGSVTEGKAEKGGAYILLTTETGAVYKLDKGDLVKSVLKRDPSEATYKTKLGFVRDIATDHINLAKWCEKQDRGRTRFKEQIRWHYENVVRLDPDHAIARKKLGYMKLDDGNWVAQAEFKSRQGYVKDRRDWVAELSQRVKANDEEWDAKLGAKKKEFNAWIREVKRGNVQPRVLANICDPSTIEMVYESAKNAQFNVELCRIHLDAIASVGNDAAIIKLAHFAIEATDQDIREHAVSLLASDQINHASAIWYLAQGLRATNRWYVHTSAFAISEVAASDDFSRETAIVPLIDSLITSHEERISGAIAPGRMNTTFGNGGSGLQMGGGPQTQMKEYPNRPSLDALKRLFEADFEYDERGWRNWYIENYTLPDISVRVDD